MEEIEEDFIECWNCGWFYFLSEDEVCPQCGEHHEDDPDLEEEEIF